MVRNTSSLLGEHLMLDHAIFKCRNVMCLMKNKRALEVKPYVPEHNTGIMREFYALYRYIF